MLKILLVEDHELFREGLKLLLSGLADEISFTEAAHCEAALALTELDRFDVVLLDLHLPGVAGMDALHALRARAERAAIVVLSAEDDPATVRKVIDAGGVGFIPKRSSHAVMIAALRLVLAGGSYLPPHALLGVDSQASARGTSSRNALSELTDRQMQTLQLAIQGKANKVIARALEVSEATVKAHLSAAFRVLGVKNRTEAVFAAARAGLTMGG